MQHKKHKQNFSFFLLIFFLFSCFSSPLQEIFAHDDHSHAEETVDTSGNSAFPAGNKEARGASMDRFKQIQYENIYLKNPFFNETLTFYSTQRKALLFEELKRKHLAEKALIAKNYATVTSRVDNLEMTIAKLRTDIEDMQVAIMRTSKEIAALGKEIKALKGDISAKNREIYETRQILLEYLAHIYKKQNVINSVDSQDIDLIRTFLLSSNGSIGDIMSELHFSSILEIAGQRILDQYKEMVTELYIQQHELQEKNTLVKKKRTDEIARKKKIEEKRKLRDNMLLLTQAKATEFEWYIQEKDYIINELELQIQQTDEQSEDFKSTLLAKYNCTYIPDAQLSTQLHDEFYMIGGVDIRDTEEFDFDEPVLMAAPANNCAILNKILTMEGKLRPFSAKKPNPFSWPIIPERGLSAYYKDPDYLKIVGTSHDAIDIRAPQGTPILAPADWYVLFMREPYDPGYSYLVVKHASGFVTVYGHLSEIQVENFQEIKQGQIIALSGWAPGTNGAGPMTSGPHLHFEVLRDRQYADPLNYLDLTVLWEYNVPKVQKYVYKYAQDFQEKYDMEYSGYLLENAITFQLEGDTETDRQQYLLNTYAASDFKDLDVWVEESLAANLDPSFLMCIGLAETRLGHTLKTPYNVGNVGNTDSGGTYQFSSPGEGIHWMTKTLNNKYLWEYTHLSQLSGYGNTTGAIYAMSFGTQMRAYPRWIWIQNTI